MYFELVHKAEPGEEAKSKGAYQRGDGLWVYRKVRARDLWEQVMRATYDHAEPGVVFLDRMNRDNNLHYCETLEATNPCVAADTWVMTTDGPRQVADLIGRRFEALVDGRGYLTSSQGFFATGNKAVWTLRTREGHAPKLTPDHQVLRIWQKTAARLETEWVRASALMPGDIVALNDHRCVVRWEGAHTFDEGLLIGMLIGDGHLKENIAVLGAWDPGIARAAHGNEHLAPGVASIMAAAEAAAMRLKHRSDFSGWTEVRGQPGHFRLKMRALRDLAYSLGMRHGHKKVTPQIERASSDFHRGFLRGYFDADGSVQGDQAKGVSVRLAQVDLAALEAVQRMLGRLGIASTIYKYRRQAGEKLLPDGKGGQRSYPTQALHDLVIAGDNLRRYADIVGFSDVEKSTRLEVALASYVRSLNACRFLATFESLESAGREEVYDVSIPEVHAFDANGLYVHNCGEQPLPSYGCCDLGSIDVARFVKNAFAEDAAFEFEAFGRAVEVSIRMLDNVLDVTPWPLEQQRTEAMAKRRVGLGFTGLGNALAMLRLKYDTREARDMAARIAEFMRDRTYLASVELAKERGAFPMFNRDLYLSG